MGFDLIDIPGALVSSGRIDSFGSCPRGLHCNYTSGKGVE